MVMGGGKPIDFSNDLTQAIGRLTTAQESWARSFGELGDSGNQWWTIFARVTSGSGLWKLQNRIRAVSNVFQAFTENSDKQRKVMIEGLEANLKLSDSMKKLKQAHKDLSNGIGKNTIVEMLIGQGATKKQAKKRVLDYYTETIKDIGKQQAKEGKRLKKSLRKQEKRGPKLSKKFDDFMGDQKMFGGRFNYTGKALQFAGKEALSPLKKMGGMTNAIFGKKDVSLGGRFKKTPFGKSRAVFDEDGNIKRRRHAAGTKGRAGFLATQKANAMKLKKIFPMIGRYLTMGLAVLGKFMLYGVAVILGLLLLVAIIKKGWPMFSEMFRSAGKSFKKALNNILGILVGVFRLIGAIFGGRPKEALEIFFKEIVWNMVLLIKNLLVGIMKILVGIIGGVLVGIWNGIIDLLPGNMGRKYKYVGYANRGNKDSLSGLHTGGLVRKSGMFNVGEKGKETVMLPRGSRVYNTEQSRNLGGNTIHVHVNGRVGASDAEIKDIANKVAREINLRMNRTGSNRIGA